MKWKSVLFSSLDGKLGDQIVGAKWKGRNYFRAYVIPANPQTNKQQAGRDVLTKIVDLCQTNILSDADAKAEWNKQALPDLISGYNLVVKQGRLSKISVPATGGTTGVNLTYTCGIPIQDAGIIAYNGAAWSEIAAKGTLTAGADQIKATGALDANTYDFYLSNADVLVSPDASPQDYQAVTEWEPDEANGVAKAAQCVIS